MQDSSLCIREEYPSPGLYAELIALSADWEAEGSCYGYRKNGKEDIDGNRIFTARDGDELIGYLFGHSEEAKRSSSIMPDGAVCFEVEELYVKPEYRNRGVGSSLFRFAEENAGDSEFIMVSTATKNYKAILHFYIEELGMEFWSARLFKKRGSVK